MNKPTNLVVIGLGYVGLPLALAFSKEIPTSGFDVDPSRVDELRHGVDRNNELSNAAEIFSKSEKGCYIILVTKCYLVQGEIDFINGIFT